MFVTPLILAKMLDCASHYECMHLHHELEKKEAPYTL